MSQLFETIKCIDGKLYNIEFHQERFIRSRKLYFGTNDAISLKENIFIPETFRAGIFRCRVSYSEKIEKIEFIPHQYRKVESLKLVYDDSIDYSLKYANREHLTRLFEKRGNCDDILIVKNRCITDSYTANPIFFDGEKWWTPDSVLLPGTQRAKLLKDGAILERKISVDDLINFEKVGLINALQPMDKMPVIATKNIFR